LSLFVTAFFMTLFFTPALIDAEEKITVGAVEEVILLPWGIRLPARIDTGAAKSSLDARGLTIRDGIAAFELPEKHGGLQLRLPIVEWRHILSPEGRERRPVVELEFCIGSKRIRDKVNLANRSFVKYPLIIGGNFLSKGFVVDVKRSKILPPTCPSIPLKHK